MSRNSIFKSSIRVMKRYKLRTFFMMLGILIGITALTLILTLGKGTQQQLMAKVERLFSASNIIINAGGQGIRGGRNHEGVTSTLTLEDFSELQKQIPNIEIYDAYQIIENRSVKYKDRSQDFRIMGNTPNAELVWNRGALSGSFFTENDIKRLARVALVGISVAKDLFGNIDPVGELIRIGDVPFQVIGVLEPMGVDPHGVDRDYEIYVPITTLMRRLMNVDYIVGAKLQLADKSKMDETAAQVTQFLRERHHISAGELDDFTLFTPVIVKQIVSKMNRMFTLFLPLVAGVSLLVGGVLVTVLMLISISERTSEIGLRRAVGARAKDILLQFVMETIVISISGGMIGFVLGVVGVQLLIFKMKLPQVVPWEAFILGMAFSTIVGMAAGILPARKAAGLEPVDALR